MKQRFEIFVTAISQINRSIQKLKSQEMADFGLKGTHVMCLFQLQQHKEGLTSSQLAQLCDEDKAAISRSISELRARGLVQLPETTGRHYRMHITLTDAGRSVTEQMNDKIIEAVMAGAQGYSQQEREIFYRVLLQIADNLQSACTSAEGENT